MAITTLNELKAALDNTSTYQEVIVSKASITSIAAIPYSAWRSLTFPGIGAIPTTAAVCDDNLLGSITFDPIITGKNRYLAGGQVFMANSGVDWQFHDRLAHMGGLSGTLTTSQTVGVDVSGAGSNMVLRRGGADYSDVQWWLDWYTATGATGVNCTVTYTNAAGTSGLTVVVPLPGTVTAQRMIAIIPANGEFIRSIQSLQLSATTGTAGNFGVTATRAIGGVSANLGGIVNDFDWQTLGFPRVHEDACIQLVILPSSTSTGVIYATVDVVQG